MDFTLLTCVPQESLEYVYPSAMFPATKFITVLTGYVPEDINAAPARRVPLRDRRTVIGYRGRDIGFRYGQVGIDKLEIGRSMREICEARGIAHDIEWTSTSASTATLGTSLLVHAEPFLAPRAGRTYSISMVPSKNATVSSRARAM